MKQEGIRRIAFIAVFLIMISLVVFWFLYKPKHQLEVSMFDIGQGDSELIETPNGRVILIDGGPDKTILRRLSEELPFWEKNIDLVILTHAHDDHYAGLVPVMKRYHVNQLMLTDAQSKSQAYQEFLKTTQEQHVPETIITEAQSFTLDGVEITILFPNHSFKEKIPKNLNNASIVARLDFGERRFLFTGDAEAPVEEELLAEKADLKSDILKLGHHGSDTSSTENFLNAVKPIAATASAGAGNSYGHPSPHVLERLKRFGIKIFRTDQDGTIHFTSDGHALFGQKTCLIGC